MTNDLLLLFRECFHLLFCVPIVGHCVCQIISTAADGAGVPQNGPELMKRHKGQDGLSN